MLVWTVCMSVHRLPLSVRLSLKSRCSLTRTGTSEGRQGKAPSMTTRESQPQTPPVHRPPGYHWNRSTETPIWHRRHLVERMWLSFPVCMQGQWRHLVHTLCSLTRIWRVSLQTRMGVCQCMGSPWRRSPCHQCRTRGTCIMATPVSHDVRPSALDHGYVKHRTCVG